MKTPAGASLAMFLVSLVLSGCGSKPDPLAARVDQLESEIAAIKADNTALHAKLNKGLDELTKTSAAEKKSVDDLVHTVVTDMGGECGKLEAQYDQLKRTSDALVAWANDKIFQSTGQKPPQKPAAVNGYKQGIPADIYDAIAVKAAKDWPLDYSIQEITIGYEVGAYKRLHP